MADGVRKVGLIWLDICLATVENLCLRCLMDEIDQKSATSADALAEMVRDLQKGGFTIYLIVTNNASKNARS
jgi:hypothetical protein